MELQWPDHIVEVVRRHRLADPDDQLVVEEALAPPELVELAAVERRRTREAVVAGHHARLIVRALAVELEELDAE
jgi:hypothetical protein